MQICYKNAITNELFLALSAMLHLATGEQQYLEWAIREWAWFEGSGLFIAKTLLAGVCIALISAYYGSCPRKTSLETMANLSGANVMSVLVILAVFFVLLMVEAT